jgi:hypothetical protein
MFSSKQIEQIQAMIPVFIGVGVFVSIFFVLVFWRLYQKAGQPGWASIVPFYNTYVLIVNILEMPAYWFWLQLVPCLNFVVGPIFALVLPFKLAEKFGKSAVFGLGLLFLGMIFYPILAFGTARHVGGRKRRDDYEDEDDYRPRGRNRAR